MMEAGMNQAAPNAGDQGNAAAEPVFHDRYDVRMENGSSLGINLLAIYYGELWQLAMSRLDHKIDGHLFDIMHEGRCYGVYRKLQPEQMTDRPHLRLVKQG